MIRVLRFLCAALMAIALNQMNLAFGEDSERLMPLEVIHPELNLLYKDAMQHARRLEISTVISQDRSTLRFSVGDDRESEVSASDGFFDNFVPSKDGRMMFFRKNVRNAFGSNVDGLLAFTLDSVSDEKIVPIVIPDNFENLNELDFVRILASNNDGTQTLIELSTCLKDGDTTSFFHFPLTLNIGGDASPYLQRVLSKAIADR